MRKLKSHTSVTPDMEDNALGARAVFVKGRDRFGFVSSESAAYTLTGHIEKQ